MHEMIYSLLKSKDLLEAKYHLKIIDDALAKQSVNRSIFCKKLSQALKEWVFLGTSADIYGDEKRKYYIYPENRSMPYYLASFGLALGRVREVRQSIKNQISYIDEAIVPPSGCSLTVEAEEKILFTLTQKFPFWEIASANSPLVILNLNSTNKYYNSFCGTDVNSKSSVIYMYNLNDNTIAAEYVFLHELGHVLQIALSGSTQNVPNEFIQFHESLSNVTKLEQGSEEAIEAFADTFAISVMRGTELSDFDPFNFHDALNERFEAFYIDLFRKYYRSDY